MKVVKTTGYTRALQEILRYIAQDNPLAASQFEREINVRLELVCTQPRMCRASNYINDPSYRDLIYRGYTVIYKIETNQLVLLKIFKRQFQEVF